MHDEELNHEEPILQQTSEEVENEIVEASPRKAAPGRGTLLLMGLVLAGIGGTYYLYVRGGPSAASASSAAQTRAADQTIQGFLNRTDGGQRAMQRLLSDTQKVVQQFLAYPSQTQVPLSGLKTNPFRHAMQATPAAQQQMGRMEAQRQQEEKHTALLKSLEMLKLQSVFLGARQKTCVINNTLYQPGDRLSDFTIETIASGSVILRCGEERFELKMQ